MPTASNTSRAESHICRKYRLFAILYIISRGSCRRHADILPLFIAVSRFGHVAYYAHLLTEPAAVTYFSRDDEAA